MYRIILLFLLGWMALSSSAKIVVYPHIEDKALKENTTYQVFVRSLDQDEEWQELQVLEVGVDMDTRQTAAMAQFDTDEPVCVRIVNRRQFSNVLIRPTVHQITAKRVGEDQVEFILDQPRKLSVEFDGDRFHNLHIFANMVEKEVYDGKPDKDVIVWNNSAQDIFRKNCKLIYFGPGIHQPKDLPNNEISIPSNCTVYLAPGALLKAKLKLDRVKNVRIVGRGYLFQPLRGIEITGSRHILVDGLTVLNPQHYTVMGGDSKDVVIRNVKSFSDRGWSDGIDLMCCKDWLIDDVFLRTSDDCLAFYNHRWWNWGDSRNLTVQNSVLWADVAHAIHVGLHGDDLSDKGEMISKVKFKNIDILNVDEDDDLYRGIMAVCSGDKNRVKDILFEDIRVEDCEEARLVDIRVIYNQKYNRFPGGRIENIVFKNISYRGDAGSLSPSRIMGYDLQSDVKGVFIKNMTVNGKKMGKEDFEVNKFVSGLVCE